VSRTRGHWGYFLEGRATHARVCYRENFTNAFVQTELDEQLKPAGVQNVILARFMTHVSDNFTARGAFNLGYAPTIVASATATRPLPSPGGETIPAHAVHVAALAAVKDRFAVVLETPSRICSAESSLIGA
jgi:nicotinamidase-related amidase